ncbi:unnamed protein product, partial [Adineta ricciae]
MSRGSTISTGRHLEQANYDEETNIIQSLSESTERSRRRQSQSYFANRSIKVIWLCSAITLGIIVIVFVGLLVASRVYENIYRDTVKKQDPLARLTRKEKLKIDNNDTSKCENDWSSQSFLANSYGNAQSKNLRSYLPDIIGHINIFIRQPTQNGRHRTAQRLRFPAARYTTRTFPILGPFTSFQVTLPLFVHSLSVQTIIYASEEAVYLLPPLFNKYGQIFSLAELIALQYAGLEERMCRETSSVNLTALFRPEIVSGPSIPQIDLTTGYFQGGIEVNYRWPLITKFSGVSSYINITYNNGDHYEGYIRNGMINGYGIYNYADGRKFVGNFINGASNGFGEMRWTDNTRYEGHWVDDVMHGNGTYYYSDGRKYVGHSVHDTADGYGEMSWPGGDRYEGSWKNDTMHGNGTYYYTDGRTYIGRYKNGIKNGFGEMSWTNGDRFIGYWKRDAMNGNGTYY